MRRQQLQSVAGTCHDEANAIGFCGKCWYRLTETGSIGLATSLPMIHVGLSREQIFHRPRPADIATPMRQPPRPADAARTVDSLAAGSHQPARQASGSRQAAGSAGWLRRLAGWLAGYLCLPADTQQVRVHWQ